MLKMKNILQAGKCILALAVILTGFSLHGSAQFLQQVQNNFNSRQQNIFQEKIFAHTDKDTYLPGEIMWFKLYCIDAATNRPSDVSKVAYIEVLDNEQIPVLQAKISLKNGAGNGSFSLPASIVTGNYKLRAYTNWMKNFGPETFYEKTVTIINVSRPATAINLNTPSYDIQFFPEGGNLVTGITSNVGVKATDKRGIGVDFKGAIVDQHNDTVVRFRPVKFGMGKFIFIPAANKSYKAIINLGNTRLIKDMPAANITGYVMQLSDNGNNLQIKVSTNTTDNTLYLFAHTGQINKVAQSANIANGAATFIISKNNLDDGVSHLTVFNSAKQPVCERLCFKRPKPSMLLSANVNMPQYTTRKKVNVQFSAKDYNGKILSPNLSMAVYKIDSLQQADPDDIMSYFWLRSNLRGNIESPGYYLKNNTAETDEITDNLMLTQGWRRFQWNKLLLDKPAAFTFLPEYYGHIITAKATDTATKQPAENVIAYLALPGKRVQMYAAKSDSAGRVLFNTKELFGPNEVIAQTNTEIDTLHRLEILSPFAEQYTKAPLPEFTLTPAVRHFVDEESLGEQVQNVYSSNKLRHFEDPGVDSSAFFGEPFKTYKLDNYTRFLTTEEVLREYIREVSVSRSGGRFHINVRDEKINLSGDPLVMLDGIPIFNINKVVALDPLKIRKLDVIRQRYYYGPSVFEGILSFTTYKGDLGGTEIDPHAIVIDYEGMQLQREFYAPVYDTNAQVNSRLPDFRTLLCWAPNINVSKTNANNTTSFYTSDQTGKYFGLIQGITVTGEMGVQTFTFEVK